MRWSDEWIIEYTNYAEEYFKGNNGIYDSLTDTQIKEVNRYFMYLTRSRFERLCRNLKLKTSPKNTSKLIDIMGDADDWVYAGCIDTGRMSGGHCELGHALRYKHFAYSKSLNKHIAFGIACASDFFGIEQKKLRYMQKVQGEALEEIKKIVFIMNTGKADTYTNKYYKDYSDMMSLLGSTFKDTVGAEFSSIIYCFVKNNLPLTSDMVETLENFRYKFYKPALNRMERMNTISKYLGEEIEDITSYASIHNLHLYRVSMDYILKYENDTSEYREKCKRFIGNQLLKLHKLIKLKGDTIILDTDTLLSRSKQEEIYIHADNGDRLATKKESILKGNKTYVNRHIYPIGKEKYQYLNILKWCLTGEDTYYKEADIDKADTEAERLEKASHLITPMLKWLETDTFKKDTEQLQKSKVVYLETAIDEDTSEFNLDNLVCNLELLIQENKPRNIRDYKLPLDIIETYHSRGSLSEKQINVLKSYYHKMITKQDTSKGYRELADNTLIKSTDTEGLVRAKYLIYLATNGKLAHKYDFPLKIARSVVEFNRCSEKQKNIIDKAYNSIVKTKKPEVLEKELNSLRADTKTNIDIGTNKTDIDSMDLFNALGLDTLDRKES